MSTSPNAFFNPEGGTLNAEDPSYVSRKADDELYNGLSRGEYCYVLTSRQMGKSSLAIRIAERLRAEETAVAQLDLTTLGHTLNPEQWYYGLLFSLGEQLDLQGELEEFWQSHDNLGPLQRWMQAVRDVILERCPGPVVLIIDEIDYVRRLPFSADEFFAAIRACFNRRADDPPMRRLTFCLLGTVTPSELIEDPNTTPFNIGRRIELNDFSEAEALTLARGLGRGEATAARLMRRIYHWTGGQPYLTQSLCCAVAVAEAPQVVGSRSVDRICWSLFFTRRARATDKNLQFVGGHLLNQEDQRRASLLDLYAKIRCGRAVPDDETSPLCGTLRLSGLVRVVDGRLRVRNRIYRRVFDQCWNRNALPDSEVVRRRRAFRQGAMAASGLAVLLIGLIGASVYFIADRLYFEHISYAKLPIRRFEAFEEFGRLTKEQVRRRPGSFEFSRQGHNGPVTKVRSVNSSFIPIAASSLQTYLDFGLDYELDIPLSISTQGCLWEFVRDAEHRVVYELARDRKGQFLWGVGYSPARSNEREPPPCGTESLVPKRPSDSIAHFVDRTGFPILPSNCAADFFEIWRTPTGEDEAVCFFDRNNKPKPNRAGIYGSKFEYDLLGQPIKCTYLGPDGRPMLCRYGYSALRISYNADGNQGRIDYLGLDGLPILNFKGFASQTFRYDNFGNPIEIAHWDTHNRRVSTKSGYSKLTFGYDERGNVTIWRYFNERDDPIPAKYGIACETAAYDASGNRTKVQFWDAEDKRAVNWQGIFQFTRAFDDQGNIIDEQWWGPDLKPARHGDGYHRRMSVYDRFSNKLEERYRDEDNRPCRCKQGFAGWIRRLDEHVREVMITYLDESDRPTQHAEGYIKKRTEYDDHSNPIRVTYLDERDRPMATSKGVHEIKSLFDELNNKVEEHYLGVQGDPVPPDGYFRLTASYDPRGNQIEQAYFDEQGRPARHKAGYARFTARYDERGNQIEAAYFDEQGRPVKNTGGYAKYTATFDDRGNEIEGAYFDEADKPARHKDGNTKWTRRYDQSGKRIEETFWGYDGSNGFAKMVVKLNDKGLGVENTYFDAQDRPTRHKDGNTKWTRRYDQSGKRIEETFWGYDGSNGFAKMIVKLNDKGLGVENTYFDAQDRPTWHKGGYTKWTRKYDKTGKLLEETFWGYDGSNGFAKMVVKLNDKGLKVEYTYFDAADKPTRNIWGYTKMTRRYDESGKPVENTYWGYDGSNGFAKVVAKLNDKGLEVEYTYLDAIDHFTKHKGGYARKINIYDDRGALVDAKFFNTGPVAVKPVVMRIIPGGQGAKLGLKEGDTFLRYAGEETANSVRFIARRRNEKTDAPPCELVVGRGEQVLTYQVSPGLLGVELNDRVVRDEKDRAEGKTTEEAKQGGEKIHAR